MKATRIVSPAAQKAALETFDLPEAIPAGHVLIEEQPHPPGILFDWRTTR